MGRKTARERLLGAEVHAGFVAAEQFGSPGLARLYAQRVERMLRDVYVFYFRPESGL